LALPKSEFMKNMIRINFLSVPISLSTIQAQHTLIQIEDYDINSSFILELAQILFE